MQDLDKQIEAAVDTLNTGGLIAYPTEAVYGLGCDPSNDGALKKLLSLKQRDKGKGLIIIASSVEQLHEFIDAKHFDLRPDIKAQWPGPITWVMPCKTKVSTYLTGDHSSLAVRVSAHPTVKSLCEKYGRAIVSTSANISGQDPAKTALHVQQQFAEKVNTIIDAPVGKALAPSKIFDQVSGKRLR